MAVTVQGEVRGRGDKVRGGAGDQNDGKPGGKIRRLVVSTVERVQPSAHVAAMYAAFLAAAVATGAPPVLAALVLGFISSLYGRLTHYASGPAPVHFGSGYVTLRTRPTTCAPSWHRLRRARTTAATTPSTGRSTYSASPDLHDHPQPGL